MNIKIYAPVDCEIYNIEKLNDGVFSEKMLGDGFYIKPLSNSFNSIFESGVVEQIFDTKHAFGIRAENGPILLMHIGLDTVKLEGKPFNINIKPGTKVNLNTKIVDVDLKMIEQNQISTATPIVLDTYDNPGWKIKLVKEGGSFKQGELIAELNLEKVIDASEKEEKIYTVEEIMKNGLDFRNAYQKASDVIYEAVGTEKNYNSYYNCVTRLRFKIKNKEEVNVDQIKKINIVKGINWMGNELQIIIGTDVPNMRAVYDQKISELGNTSRSSSLIIQKEHWGIRLFDMFKGVVLPALPALIAVSLINALYALLTFESIGLLPQLSMSTDLVNTIPVLRETWSEFSIIMSAIIFLACQGAMSFIGIFFAFNAVKYLKGNPSLGILLGLIIVSPALIRAGSTSMGISAFEWKWNEAYTATDSWIVLKIGAYQGSFILTIPAAWFMVKLERIISSNLPKLAVGVVGGFITVLITTFAVYLVFGPITGLIEGVIGKLISYATLLPWGLGTAMYATLGQALVITGAHISLAMIVMQPWLQGDFAQSIPLLAASFCSVTGLMGAAIAIYVTTKNQNDKNTILASLVPSIFGITEPVMYGVLVPRGKPFAYGLIGTFFGAWLIGAVGTPFYMSSGPGILKFLGIFPMGGAEATGQEGMWIGIFFLAAVISFAIAFAICYFFASDKIFENKNLRNVNRKMRRALQKCGITELTPELEMLIKQLDDLFDKETMLRIRKFENNFLKKQKIDIAIQELIAKENEKKSKVAEKINIARASGDVKKIEVLINKINTISYDAKVNALKTKAKLVDDENGDVSVDDIYEKASKIVENIGQSIEKMNINKEINKFNGNYLNAINMSKIYLELDNKNEDIFKMVNLKQLLKKDSVKQTT